MSWLDRLLGGRVGGGADSVRSTESVRRIADRLDRLPSERAHFVAATACVLARVAGADLRVEPEEVREMERVLVEVGGLEAEEAALAVELALAQAEERGVTDQYLATREFRERSTKAERARLVECLFAVAAADGTITVDESHVALAVAEELGFTRPEAMGLRARWRDQLAELRKGGAEKD